ncbi:error-prone DNA polymerase [Enemella evansiae]|uniref:error-prone DNA polymerase n=1 Tax=Enemella evansiae TaxID=2016499 RepID=UPI000B968212|nr:error-prone DNA polymerase [Enemella evansiae]OYN94572.1 error-prone DNA polymerase [Enemella evansiae]
MGWQNPPISWGELERRLSGRPRFDPHDAPGPGTTPAPRRRRQPPLPQDLVVSDGPHTPYAELHCHSSFSFLDGASSPEELITEAVRLGLSGLAITDHDGLYAASRFAEAAAGYTALGHRLDTVFGAELSLGLTTPQNGIADPEGAHLLVLARGAEGYHRLSAAITRGQLIGDEKGRPLYSLEELAATAEGHWQLLTGCRKGIVRSALRTGGRAAARSALDRLVALFGRDQVAVELTGHGDPRDSGINAALAELAAECGLPVVATNNVHHATPERYRLATAMAAVRAGRSLAELDGWLAPPGAHLRSGAEQQAAFAAYPDAITTTLRLAAECAFPLQAARPRLPRLDVPDGYSLAGWLRELCRRGLAERYPGARYAEAQARLDRELAVIERKGFAGYFIIVHDMVAFAKGRGILCQGRGSAANSVICYTLGITAVDPVKFGLPFERFMSETRDDEPDIDVDFDSDRREEVIQEVYRRFGRHNAAQVANVISYRPRSAVRDMAKALGHSPGQQDAWSTQIDSYGDLTAPDGTPAPGSHEIPAPVLELAEELLGAPRHLGIHSGGMVLTERPVGEICPIERGRMENRTVLQWDKDSCAWMGLVKFDFLGLGILAAIQYSFDLVADRLGERWTLAGIPKEEAGVYDMLCVADSIGVFQVESRAQIGTLPRLLPRRFYDLVVEIALIRPGPIQGGAVHPYVRRATGKEPVSYPHPLLEPILERTLGVPLFQEQLMQMAMVLGDCTGDQADLLRRAMGSARGVEKIERIREQLFAGMAAKGITGELAESIYARIEAFANFGFAESHAISFALLVYASSWLKLHYPGAFLAGLLRAQPMGFYSPQSLTADARRRGVEVRRPDVTCSQVHAELERIDPGQPPVTGSPDCLATEQPPAGPAPEFDRDRARREHQAMLARHRRDGNWAVRLGLTAVRGIGTQLAERIVAERERGPFRDQADVLRRVGLTAAQAEALAVAGAFDAFGRSRRQALWSAGYTDNETMLPGAAIDAAPPEFAEMLPLELTQADLWSTSISPDDHPVDHLRPLLTAHGLLPVDRLGPDQAGRRIRVAGLVTHRQHPGTAGGVTFLNLEDETGMLNVVCSVGVWARYRKAARRANVLIVRGIVEHAEGVTNLVADRIEPLVAVLPEARELLPTTHRSRDFR